MIKNRNKSVLNLENSITFPNLLKDKDFPYYCWSLPFCN
jgi:hypothetical protein